MLKRLFILIAAILLILLFAIPAGILLALTIPLFLVSIFPLVTVGFFYLSTRLSSSSCFASESNANACFDTSHESLSNQIIFQRHNFVIRRYELN
ncbi:MAG: hypothetical protein RMI34_01535 [Chloroherpetonaceae bacterium]|nr:hypothetical protein [Chloroherpetonaceae bacterium]MCS7212125.1 hypothetical protein [Chloroherpetonaceae bacterium]MDW8018738.1 hypothetical protein [Chloroherpetonaceae bacterium]MDW8465927.1 hypothetical protein [Chloroherpetonaceae bacterium]